MKKKIFVIAIIMAIITCLCACASEPSPTDAADSFLKAVKNQNNETLSEVYAGGSLDLLNEAAESSGEAEQTDSGLTKVYEEEMIPKMLDFDYELSNEQVNEDKATVDVKIQTYNIGDAFTAFFSDYISQAFVLAFSDVSEEELDSLATTILSGKLADLTERNYETTATINLTKTDGKWIVDEISGNVGLIDGLTGGLMTSFGNMTDALSGWED